MAQLNRCALAGESAPIHRSFRVHRDHQRAALAQLLTSEGPCLIDGELYDLGDYPGLMAGDGHVVGELYRLNDLKALRLIDRFERYDATDPEGSLYLRRCVRLAEPSVDVWVYFYNVAGRRHAARAR